MTLAGDAAGMDREDLTDRIPTDRAPLGRVPGLGGESEPEPTDTFDGSAGASDATGCEEKRGDAETEAVGNGEDELTDEEGPSRREQARKALLGVSIGGGVLAVLAAVLRRLLGGDESEGASEEDEGAVRIELEDEETEPAPDAEAVAAVIGLAFQLLVRRLVGEDDPEA